MNTYFDYIISKIHMETVNNCLIKNETIDCSLFVRLMPTEHFAIHTANSCSGWESLEAGFDLTSQRCGILKSYTRLPNGQMLNQRLSI